MADASPTPGQNSALSGPRDDRGRPLVPNQDARILVLGCAGMLGRNMTAMLSAHSIDWLGADCATMDLANPAQLRREAAHAIPRHGVVINCAAWTNVDGAESNEPGARSVNATGVALLAELCRDAGATLVHISTDYVFNGDARRDADGNPRPWQIDDPIDPINAYGRTKAEGEQAIRATGCEHLILRTSWLHAAWGNNFVRTIARLCLTNPRIRVVADQVGRPTCCWHLASAMLALLLGGARGTLHVTDGGEPASWHCFATEIARHVARRWRNACEVVPCTTAEFPRPAQRPAYSVLDLTAAEAIIGPRPDWRVGLAEVMATVEKPA
ncbi:MAG: dTDP-4-dehydrorhamnose reductase [Phycisphaeraceae bacterium]|nr:dTDP-4-dehydrorhamnose reductase [Phycisphaeraceae bacterium]